MADSSRSTRPFSSNASSSTIKDASSVEFVLLGASVPSERKSSERTPRRGRMRRPSLRRPLPAGAPRVPGAARRAGGSLLSLSGPAALVISLVGFVLSTTVAAGAHDAAATAKAKPKASSAHSSVLGHPVSTRPYSNGILVLGKNRKFPSSAIPTVSLAHNAQRLDNLTAEQVAGSCPPKTVDLGSWCLESAPFPLSNSEIGQNNYVWAAKKCVEEGGWLPSAAQLLGAANRVRLESTINDNPDTSTIDQDPTEGLKDQREMTSTLVTTQAGSDAAGSEGVTEGSTGNPQTGEPNPVPQPAVPMPETLQYVTVYSNHEKGGFAGSEPVSAPENFRCAYNKTPGALQQSEE